MSTNIQPNDMLESKIKIYVNTYVRIIAFNYISKVLDKSNASYSATLKVSYYDVSHLNLK